MKKNGYTLVELLAVIAALGILTIVVLVKTSYAFKDNTEELINDQKQVILNQSVKYGENSEELKENKEMIIMVSDLVESGYFSSDNKDNEVFDVTGKKINEYKIKLAYDEENDRVDATLID